MPHLSESTSPPPRSRNSRIKCWNSAPERGQFTESKQSDGGKPHPEARNLGLPDPEASEPFPPDLFRVPVPNEVFSEMPGISDAALRCLLGLIRLSWRFDPEEGSWIDMERHFSRRDVQEECGLSDEGTRQGLSGLEDKGWVSTDRSGRSYKHRLNLDVPTRRYTYLPTSLLERASEFASATALRVLLAVFRGTWGWTQVEDDPKSEGSRTVHRRWTCLSTSDLSRLTGRSETAVKRAAKDLAGEWIGRGRLGQGAYQYRILAEAFGLESAQEKEPVEDKEPDERLSSPPVANDLAPERQRSGPPASFKESKERDKHSQNQERQRKTGKSTPLEREKSAMPGDSPPEDQSQRSQKRGKAKRGETNSDTDLEDLSPGEQSLARKLINAGVWPERARDCLKRYSRKRIEANFELYRKRAPEIDNDGAWLCAAITDGYADVQGRSQDRSTDSSAGDPSTTLNHKQKVSAEEKRALVRQCAQVSAENFHRFSHPGDPSKKQFLYLDPEIGGPEPRAPQSKKPEPGGWQTETPKAEP